MFWQLMIVGFMLSSSLSQHFDNGFYAHLDLFRIRFNVQERQMQFILHKFFQKPGLHDVSMATLPCQIDYGACRQGGVCGISANNRLASVYGCS
jgi:hypothetical protein